MDFYIGRYNCFPVFGALRNFGNYRGGNISGYKLDTSGNGLSGWNITLVNETLHIYRYDVTDGSGYYEILDVPVGIYELNETLADWPDWIPVEGNRTVEINLTTWDLFNQNFTNQEKGGNVSGFKLNESGYGLPGWNITLSNATAGFFGFNITNATGYYIIENVPQNSYWLNETLESGWTQLTPNRIIELNGTYPSLSNQNFTNQWENGIIEGYKLNETGYGLSGWTIELYNGTQLIDITTTDVDGYYNFTDLPADTYNVSEVLETGWTSLGPLYYDNQDLNDQTSPITGLNFTNRWENGIIEGYKLNETGYGLSGWTIELYNGTQLIDITTTDVDGYYNFTGLPADIYNVSEVLKNGWTALGPLYYDNQDLNDQTSPITGLNFTNQWENGIIEGYKLNDTGYGLSGWTIELYNGTQFIDSTTTDGDGYYNFTDLPADTYNVSEVLETGWTALGPLYYDNQDLNDQTSPITGLNFTNRWENGIIEGYKLNETGYGLSGWTIELYNDTQFIDSTTTDGDGYYNFTDLPADTYNVSEVLETGWTALGPLYYDNQDLNDQTSPITGLNFTNERLNGTISGYKLYPNQTGIEGWNITLYNETAGNVLYDWQLTGSDGSYTFTGLPYGVTFNVSEVIPAGWTAIGDTYHNNLYIDGGLSYENQNFTNEQLTGSISGYKLYPNQTGIEGWNITLYNETAGNVLYDWQLTGSDGSYTFTGLPYGVTFNVSEVIPAGWTAIGPTYHNGLYIDGGLFYENQNFTNERLTGYISGYKIQNETGLGVPGWTIEAYNQSDDTFAGSDVTDGTGFYNITGLPYGVTYNVSEVVQPGWTPVSPVYIDSLTIDEQTPYHLNVNFTNDPPVGTGTVSGHKYRDNCIEEGCGLGGWTITLSYASNGSVYASTTTKPCCGYQFLDVPYGSYWLNETVMPGWTQVSPNILVTLTAENPDVIYDFINSENTTCCSCPPVTSFSYVKDGTTVSFTDTSTGPEEIRWIWFFGDGTISTEQNPVKTYAKPGSYTVRMYVNWQNCAGQLGAPGYWESASQRVTIP